MWWFYVHKYAINIDANFDGKREALEVDYRQGVGTMLLCVNVLLTSNLISDTWAERTPLDAALSHINIQGSYAITLTRLRGINTTRGGDCGAMRFEPQLSNKHTSQSPVFEFLIVLVGAKRLIKSEVLSHGTA